MEKTGSVGRKRVPAFVPWVLLLLSISATGYFSSRMIEVRSEQVKRGPAGAGNRGALLEISRRPSLSFGFRNVLADVAWLEAVQVVGNPKMLPADYDRVFELLTVTANFDAKFEIPYFLGGLVLGESPVHTRKALMILERGKQQYPAEWRFPFYIGFTQYFSLGDAAAGGEAMAEAARMPGSPAYLPGLASRMLLEGREPESALALLKAIAGQETDSIRRSVLERRIREVTAERDLQTLEQAVARYRGTIGAAPTHLSDLVREGILAGIPAEPNGGRYLLGKDGQVRSDRTTSRPRVFRNR